MNPENGLTSYAYDLNGNVFTVTPGAVTRCYGAVNGSNCVSGTGYDALNRPLAKSYIDAAATGTLAATVTPSSPTSTTTLPTVLDT